jgi:protein-S-isoprenylcysteine O-methyltransferase Ste14
MTKIDVFFSALFIAIYGGKLLYQTYLLKNREKPKEKAEWAEFLLVVIPKNILVISTIILLALGVSKNFFFLVGWFVFLSAIVFRFVALKQLGSMYSLNIEIRENHKLIDSGIFSVIRHPLYLAYILDTLGIILFLQNIIFIPVIISIIIGVSIRIKNEEKRLEEVFGQQYLDYKKRTSAVVPLALFRKGTK